MSHRSTDSDPPSSRLPSKVDSVRGMQLTFTPLPLPFVQITSNMISQRMEVSQTPSWGLSTAIAKVTYPQTPLIFTVAIKMTIIPVRMSLPAVATCPRLESLQGSITLRMTSVTRGSTYIMITMKMWLAAATSSLKLESPLANHPSDAVITVSWLWVGLLVGLISDWGFLAWLVCEVDNTFT